MKIVFMVVQSIVVTGTVAQFVEHLLCVWEIVGLILSQDTSKTLTFATLWENSAVDKVMTFLLFFAESRIWHFMPVLSLGDNLHEVSDPIFEEK